ncbi:hypothetical protein ACFX15_029692 [Malus domestica]
MDVYAVVSLQGDDVSRASKQKTKTNVSQGCGTHPIWNFHVKFILDEYLIQQNRISLVFKLVCPRSLCDKDIGHVVVFVKELLDFIKADAASMKFVAYQVRKPSGKPKNLTVNHLTGLDPRIAILSKKLSSSKPYRRHRRQIDLPLGRPLRSRGVGAEG